MHRCFHGKHKEAHFADILANRRFAPASNNGSTACWSQNLLNRGFDQSNRGGDDDLTPYFVLNPANIGQEALGCVSALGKLSIYIVPTLQQFVQAKLLIAIAALSSLFPRTLFVRMIPFATPFFVCLFNKHSTALHFILEPAYRLKAVVIEK
jgi:hypothetical protein